MAVLSSAAWGTSQKEFQPMSCLTPNPLRNSYKAKGIEIFSRSIQDTKSCSGEWDIRGTCCDVDAVSRYTTKKIEDNQKSLKGILAELETIAPELDKFIQSYLGEASTSSISPEVAPAAPAVETQPAGGIEGAEQPQEPAGGEPGSAEPQAEAPVAESQPAAASRLLHGQHQHRQPAPQTPHNAAALAGLKAQLQAVVNDLKLNKDTLVQQQTRCMAKINLIVGVSPCSICSGNSAQYFENGRLKMEERVCRDVLADCHHAWARLVDISKKVQTFSDLASKLVGADLDDPADSTSPKMGHAIMNFAKKTDIWAELAACEDPENCPFQSAADLCERFISLDKENYAEKLGGEIKRKIAKNGKKLRKKMSKFAKKFKANLKKLKKFKSLLKSLSKFKGAFKDLKRLNILKKMNKLFKKISSMKKKFKKIIRTFSKTGKVCKKMKSKIAQFKLKMKKLLGKAKKVMKKAAKFTKQTTQKLSRSKQLSTTQKAKLSACLKQGKRAATSRRISIRSAVQGARVSVSSHKTVSVHRHVAAVSSVRAFSRQQTWSSTSVSRQAHNRGSGAPQNSRGSGSRSSGRGRKLQTLLASGSSKGMSEVGVVPNNNCNPCAPFNGMEGP